MKLKLYRTILFFASVIAAAGCHCLAQGASVTLRIGVQPRPPFLTTGSSGNILADGVACYSARGLIASVNGEPAGGYWSATILTQEVGPPTGVHILTWTFDIIQADGTPAGVIAASGILDGPGLPMKRNFPIVGSTNAYYGVHGTVGAAASTGLTNSEVQMLASGSGELNFVAILTPLCKPTVAVSNGLPAIAHGKDFTPVTSNSPAEPGEILSLVATDLLPELKESTPWPAEPEAVANAPVTVRVGGLITKILYIGKYPGAQSAYQINFRVPPEVQAGIVDVQISTGFIGGPVVSIPVR